ncbi:unnamed protein product [Cylindrotheca closterium]|uniref:Uncharacterized protein n=1 Tax=Cylindrotheca closterium TaxID=2856 RepID=A0AAD2CES1_9STRA|nr:unnamed protein product [Cylindrotheca closterium]
MSDWSTLPPPEISAKQCQKLTDKYFEKGVPLAGRPMMIPFTKQAFLMGELQPVTTRNSESGNRTIEHVQVRPGKEKKLQILSTNDAKQWLLKKAQPALTKPPVTAPVTQKPTQSSTFAKQTQSQTSNNTSASPSSSKRSIPQSKSQQAAAPIPFHPTMVEIHEEFNEDGTQTKGDVVNVSSEFQALMDKIGQGDTMSFPQGTDMSGETKEEQPENGSDEEMITIDYDDTPQKQLSDPEYDQLAQRLDELARLEESENQRLQEGTSNSKLKAQRAAGNKKKNSSGSGGWNKGFLNQPKKNKSAQKRATTRTQSNSTKNSQSSGQAAAGTSSKSEVLPIPTSPESQIPQSTPAAETTPLPPATTGGVAFDLSQNQVQEIPSLPGTRPLPPRNNVSMPPNQAEPTVDETTRIMNSTAFSGVVQERPTVSVAPEGEQIQETNTIQERSAPPQSKFRRRRQQQQQMQQKPQDQSKKKLSRFAQERMG